MPKRNLKAQSPVTRAFIKQEADDSKESLNCALYGPEKTELSLSRVIKNENTDDTNTLQSLDKKTRKRHCGTCNTTFKSLKSFLDHDLHFHKAEKKPIVDIKTLYCNICNTTSKNMARYRLHMADLNGIDIPLFYNKRKPIQSKTPDIHGTKNYCIPCDHIFASRKPYFRHLFEKHGISSVPRLKQPSTSENTPTIIDMHTLYCDACDVTYDTKKKYVSHIVRYHRMRLPDTYSDLTNFDTINQHCKVCDITYKDGPVFKKHLRNIHYIEPQFCYDVIPDENEQNHLIPDVNDPDHFCFTCDKGYGNRTKYLNHISTTHFDLLPEIHQGIDCTNPSSKDINFKRYCSDCQKVFLSRHLFKIHLDNVHKIKQKLLPSIDTSAIDNPSDPDVLAPRKRVKCSKTLIPEVDISTRYCDVCDKSYSSLKFYMNHMTKQHHIEFSPSEKLSFIDNPNEKPIISKTGSYCITCDKLFKNRSSYKTHLHRTHGVLANGDRVEK